MMEVESTRRAQAALEAIEILREAGFVVNEDFTVEPEKESPYVSLELDLAIPENERPLEAVGPCERDDCPRGD